MAQPLRIAIVGSRDYPNLEFLRAFIRTLAARNPAITIVSGGARGVDSVAADEARRSGLAVVEYKADWDGLGKRAGFLRNTTIVENADVQRAYLGA